MVSPTVTPELSEAAATRRQGRSASLSDGPMSILDPARTRFCLAGCSVGQGTTQRSDSSASGSGGKSSSVW